MTQVFPGTVNFRDIGAAATAEVPIRSGRLFRSGLFHHLTDQDLRELIGTHRVRTVVDLRTPREHAAGLANWDSHGVRHHHVPLFDYDAASIREQITAITAMLAGKFDWAQGYRTILDRSPGSFVQILTTLAEPDALPAIVHCTAGRDRTGIAMALLLDLLGAPIEVIADDYARTSQQIQPHLRLIATESRAGWMHPRLMGRIVRTEPATMVRFIGQLRNDFGSSEQLLRKHGLTADTVDRLRAALLR